MKTRAVPDQRGFSTFGMFVSFILGGLLMLLVARGSGMIDTARAWQAARMIDNLDAAITTYRDRYGALPGDDPNAPRFFGRPPARFWVRGRGFVSLAGNGRIDGDLLEQDSPLGEQYMAWRDLRLAKLWPGDAALVGRAAMPDTPFGGLFGLAERHLGLRGVACMTAVPGAAAAYIDEHTDDGRPASGRTRARSETIDGTDGETYRDGATYLVCTHLNALP